VCRYGTVLRKQGKHARAEPVWRELLEGRRLAYPAGHWRIGEAEILLGHCLTQLKRFPEVEPLLLAAHERVVRAKGPEAPPLAVFASVAALVELYDAWGRDDEAARWRARLPKTKPR
jgi:hypothetical protein